MNANKSAFSLTEDSLTIPEQLPLADKARKSLEASNFYIPSSDMSFLLRIENLLPAFGYDQLSSAGLLIPRSLLCVLLQKLASLTYKNLIFKLIGRVL